MIAATIAQGFAVALAIAAALVLLLLEVLIAAGISALRNDFEQLELDVRSVLSEVLERDRAEAPQPARPAIHEPPVAGDPPARTDS